MLNPSVGNKMPRRRDSLRKKRRKISGLHSNPNRGDRRGGSPVRVLPCESPTWGRMFLCREGYGNCFITGAVRFFAENGWLFDVFEIRDFRNGIQTRFVSPRVRQRRGRWSPPFVAPAGSRPEATGAFTPPGIPPPPPGTTSPVTSSRPSFNPFPIRTTSSWQSPLSGEGTWRM